MKSHYLLSFALLIILIACQPKLSEKNQSKQVKENNPQKPPNILFLFTDDQRFNTIHALGNSEIVTPNLDQLVKTGTSFTNAYIFGAMNGAVCAPSRGMLMTGRSIFRLNPYHANHLEMPDTLLPRALANNGYQTFHTGKWHNGRKAFTDAFDDGAKIFFGGMSDQYKAPTYGYSAVGNYPDSLKEINTIHSSELYANAAINQIQQLKDDQPFMMYVAFQAPHDPRNVSQNYIDLYEKTDINLPPNFKPAHPFDNGELDIRDEWLAGYPRTEAEVKANIIAYYAMITHLDEQIGRILTALEERELRENTIIVFSSDNGIAVGQHGLMGKQNLYEHSIKVPLIFQGPSIPANQRKEALTYLIDLYPTLCELTNTTPPKLIEGNSLVPIIRGKKDSHRTSMIYAYKSNQRAYRKGNHKLIKYQVNGSYENQLFDLKTDPWEIDNLYLQPKYQSVVTTLEKEMQQQLTAFGDKAILSEADWGIEQIPSWINKVSQKTIDWLRGLAKRERKLRGF